MLSRTLGGSRMTGPLMILIGIGLAGCSEQADPGLDLGPGGVLKTPTPAAPSAESNSSATTAIVKATSPTADAPLAPIRPEDVEMQVRTALRAAERGEEARATQILDAVLAVEPVHREALAGRGKLAFLKYTKSKDPAERAAAISKAAKLARSVRRAYEKSNKGEEELFGRVLYNEAKLEAESGRFDNAVKILKESYDAGLDPFFRVEKESTLVAFRSAPIYKTTLDSIDAAATAKARERLKSFLDRPLPLAFDFKLPDLGGQAVSLSDFRGKVVIVDFWGTWCKPCVKEIPGLVDLHQKQLRRGLAVVGLAYEQNWPEYAKQAIDNLKEFSKAFNIQYPILIGDESTIAKVPGFIGFPTTVVIDRAGKVRLLITENPENTVEILTDVANLLLAEAAPKPIDSSKRDPKPTAAAEPIKAAPKPSASVPPSTAKPVTVPGAAKPK